MQNQRPHVVYVALVALAGCASSNTSTAPAASPTAAPVAGGEAAHHPHPDFPPTVAAFHDVLRPLWHSEATGGRDNRTCEQAEALNTRATAVVEAALPRAGTASAQLASTSAALQATCTATPRGNVAGGLEAVHTAFHGLIEQLSPRR